MKYSQLLAILKATNLSPEILAPKWGVSNMTLRRWSEKNPNAKVPKAYVNLTVEAVYQLIAEGHLDAELPAVRALLQSTSPISIDAAVKSLGVNLMDGDDRQSNQDRLTQILSQLGVSDQHQSEVDSNELKINSFKKLGRDWKKSISSLMKIVKSDKLATRDKLVAYGALFYLIYPFDLIPDHIPVFGLLDDFAVLGLAATYYFNRFSES
jgi:uncharacterized membrane protein YkvA (DUF1232 family)